MKPRKFAVLVFAVGICLSGAATHGASVTTDLVFEASSSLFGGAPSSSFEIGPDSLGIKNIAEVHYEAKASTGTVDASVKARLLATHPDKLTFSQSASVPVDLALKSFPINAPDSYPDIIVSGAIGSFETAFGIEANVELELFGFADLKLLDIDGLLETSAASLRPLNDSLKASDETSIASAGKIKKGPLWPFVKTKWGAKATVFGTQESELSFGSLTGTVRATHEDGAIVTDTFTLDMFDTVVLNLQHSGDWDLDLTAVTVDADFSSDFGLRIGGKVCVAICGKIKSGILPLGSASFDLPFSKESVLLGTLTVTAIPLPAGLPLLTVSLGILLGLRSRRRKTGLI